MLQTVSRNVRAALQGIGSFHVVTRQDYNAYVPQNAGQVCKENWNALGERLRESANKVEKEYGRQL